MNRLKYLALTLVLGLTIIVSSCDSNNEPIDPVLNQTIGNNNGNNPNNPGVVTPSNDYWPTAINNKWVMKENNNRTYTLKFTGTELFSGANYYKFAPITNAVNGLSVGANTWLNKFNGTYTLKTGDVSIDFNGITGNQTGFDMIILKENLPVGGTWAGTYQQTTTYPGIPVATTQTTEYNGTVIEKNTSVVVNNVTYNDVIKVHINQITSEAAIVTSEVDMIYWFAKNIGPVKIIQNSDFGDYETILIDYTLY